MNNNRQIGWIVNEATEDPIDKPKIIDSNGRRVTAEVILQRMNSKNRNGRFYADKDLAPQLTCPRSKELIKTGWGMENGHPMSKDLIRQQTIDPNNVVSYLTKVWVEGDFIHGYVRGSNSAIGEAFDQDLRDGFLPAWSLRALGAIENTSRGAEVKGVKIITWDRVYYPSHPEAYTVGIVSESTASGILLPKTPIPKADKSMNEEGLLAPIVNQQVIDYIKSESCNLKTIEEQFDVFYDSIKLINEGSQVQLTDKNNGSIYIVAVENYIHNEIMDYCSNR
jgi:hypothetical protein